LKSDYDLHGDSSSRIRALCARLDLSPRRKASTRSRKTIALIRKLAVRWNLIPKTMKGKELLKRIFYGRLVVMGPEIEENMAKPGHLCTVPENGETAQHKVLYAIGRSRTNVPICNSLPSVGFDARRIESVR